MEEIKVVIYRIKKELKEMKEIRKELKRLKQLNKALCKIIKIVNKYGLKITRAESTSGERYINIYGLFEV